MRNVLARHAVATAALVGAALASPTASAQPEAEVALTRDPPFDKWCFAPLCADASGEGRVAAPLTLPPTANQGLVEQQLRAAIERGIQDAIAKPAARWNNRATRDVLRAVVASLLRDKKALETARGLGSAAMRAGLVYAADRAMPLDPGCTDAARVDAIYEGFALSPLGALEFVEVSHRVTSACVPTARRAEHLADRAVLSALAPVAGSVLADADARLREVSARCDASSRELDDASVSALTALSQAKNPATFGDLARAFGRLELAREALTRDTPHLGDACARELAALGAIDPRPFDRLASIGLAEASTQALAAELRGELAACDGPTACQARDALVSTVASLASGKVGRDQLTFAIRTLVASVVPGGEDPGVALAAIKALELAVVDAGAGATLDPDVVVRELEDRYELRDGRPTVRTLLGLGPSPWIVELNGGVPKLDSNDMRFVGDTTLGYESKSLGVVVRGGLRYYDFSSNLLATDNLDAVGSLESWYVTGDDRSPLRFETRLAGGTEYVDTTTLTHPAGLARTDFGDYDSLLLRASLLLGLRVRPSERFLAHVLVGGGAQYETHDSTSVDRTGIKFNSPDTTSAQGQGRLDVRYKIVPQILSLRAHGEGAYFALTREELAFASNVTGAGQAAITATQENQLFLSGRIFVDADVIAFGGFVPALFGGLDYTLLTADAGERSTSVPVVGVGIVRPRL